MLLKRFYDQPLAQASYLIGCSATGEAIVVDANRDVQQYVDAAAAESLRVTQVTETHIHADYVSGSRELAHRAGATLLLSSEGGEEWQYLFAPEDGATLLRGGDAFMVGNVRVDVVHTPGHTPEHLTFLITDTAGASEPMGALTGDFIFAGDVGRPDLLERAARLEGTMQGAARALFKSIKAFSALPDYLQIWPGHGAGSACGKSLGAVPQTTLGYERRFNWAFAIDDEQEFVRQVLAGQPEPPTYFAQMKRINREGPALLGERGELVELSADDARTAVDRGDFVIDVRPAASFAKGHLPGTVNIPLNKAFTTWAGWLLPYDRDLVLIADERESAEQARRNLALIGLDRVRGLSVAPIEGEVAEDGRRATIAQIEIPELRDQIESDAVAVLDVRTPAEYRAGHLPGAYNIPLGELPARLAEVPTDKPLVVHCQAGGRAAIAASVLQARGVGDVRNLRGGFAEWERGGLPLER